MPALADRSTRPSSTTNRLLRSGFVDLLLGPHGIDRYLELVAPVATVTDARARVTAVRRQTPRTVTLTLAPNRAFTPGRAGQFISVGVEIDGVRRTRTYSPASSEHRPGELELTVTARQGGLVSRYLVNHACVGTVLHLGPAAGELTLPEPRPSRLVLISGGSGITPVIAIARTLVDERHSGAIRFLHYAPTERDWLYWPQVRALRPDIDVDYRTTRGARASRCYADAFGEIVDDDTWAVVCGPPSLIDAARSAWSARGGRAEQLRAETFAPPSPAPNGASAAGTVRFERSGRSAPIDAGTLLAQAEGAGLSPEFGCRMGICRTCTCRKLAGSVRNVRTGEVCDEPDVDVQLCISVPAGDVSLDL